MGVKTLLTAGLTSLALAGGGAWAYVHYNGIYGGCSGCSSAPAPSASSESCCDGAETSSDKDCCKTPSRQSILEDK